MDDLEFRVGKLSLEPGDVLVVKMPQDATQAMSCHAARVAREATGGRALILVLTDGFDLTVLRAAEIASRFQADAS